MRRNQGLARVIVSAVTGSVHPDLVPFASDEVIYDLHEVRPNGSLRLVGSYTVDSDGEMHWLPAA